MPVSSTGVFTIAGTLAWSLPLDDPRLGPGGCSSNWDELLWVLNARRMADGNRTDVVYYGLLPAGIPLNVPGCGEAGLGAGASGTNRRSCTRSAMATNSSTPRAMYLATPTRTIRHMSRTGRPRSASTGLTCPMATVLVRVLTFLQPSLPFGTVIFPPDQSGQTVLAGEVSASGGGFLGLGEVDSQSVAGYYGMYYQNFVVPGGQLAVFEAGSIFSAGAGNGDCSAQVDFLSGDFQVLCPIVDLIIVAP
jgi:hypothetical protein